jgi:hypothetical protein
VIAGINIQQKSPAEKAGLFCVWGVICLYPSEQCTLFLRRV